MKVKNNLVKGMLVATLVAGMSPLAIAVAATAPVQQEQSSFRALSEQGQRAFMDINAARVALYEGYTKQATEHVAAAQKALATAKSDNTSFMKAEAELHPLRGKTAAPGADKTIKPWIPVWGDMVITDDYSANPQKVIAVQQANAKLKAGDGKGALQTLKLSDINVESTTAVAPLRETIATVDKAAGLLANDKFYEANLVLKQAQEGVRYDIVDASLDPVKAPPTPAAPVAPSAPTAPKSAK